MSTNEVYNDVTARLVITLKLNDGQELHVYQEQHGARRFAAELTSDGGTKHVKMAIRDAQEFELDLTGDL
jgi:hypothetical protein